MRDLHFGKAARGTSVNRFRNFSYDPAYRSPAANYENDQCDLSAFQVLLVVNAFVGRL